MEKEKLKKLFSGFCCSNCRHDFDESAIFIKREEKNLLVLQIICPECGKSFGLALLGTGALSVKDKEDDEFVIQDCPKPISFDDVIDAHQFINNLGNDWTKYIPDELKNN